VTHAPSASPPPVPAPAVVAPVPSPAVEDATDAIVDVQPAPAAPREKPVEKLMAGVDVDWDDEDEATHIFDESNDVPKARTAPVASPSVESPVTSGASAPKPTLVGVTASATPGFPPPPPAVARTPPPPASPLTPPPRGSAFPPVPSSGPGVPAPAGLHVPPPPGTQPGLGAAFASRLASSSPAVPGPLRVPAPPVAPLQTQHPTIPRPAPLPDYLSPHPTMESTALVRPQPSRMGLWIVLGLAGAALLCLVWFSLNPHTGTVLVNVTDAKGAGLNRVDIFVDGRKVCDTAPCKVEQVGAGSHEIKVLAEGFDTASTQTVAIESHKDSSVSFVIGGPKGGAGLRVSGSQPGVKLYIDDREIGPLPQEVHDLTPGDHAIRVAGSDRYQPLEKHVTIEKDQVDDVGTVTLKVLRGKATVSLGTLGARVYLVSGSDRRELPTLPISVDIDTTKTWSLEASKLGFDDYRQPISFDDGQAEKAFTVTLDPKASGGPVAWTPPPPPAAAPPAPATPAPAAAPAPAPATPALPPAAAAPTEGEGFLNINSIPPSTCFLDGHPLGSTPRVHVSVTPGTHTVKFINADQGLTKTITVTVGAGETKRAVTKLN
jgi:serine/threonine-protein kinase